jgi:hypothetical protein
MRLIMGWVIWSSRKNQKPYMNNVKINLLFYFNKKFELKKNIIKAESLIVLQMIVRLKEELPMLEI